MTKKILSLLSVLVIALSTSLTVCSTAHAVTITVDGTAEEYKAYRLLDLTVGLKKDGTHPAECDGAKHVDGCYNYAYTVNQKYSDILKEACPDADTNTDGKISDSELIEYIGGLSNSDMRTFADGVWKKIVAKGDVAADVTTTDKQIVSDKQGYYLIAETVSSDDPDSVSLVMIDTAGAQDVTVTSKEGTPSLEKKVLTGDVTIDDATGNLTALGTTSDATDAAVGDTVHFVLTGGMPDNIDNYDKYKYLFHDKISDGLAIDKATIKVYIDNTLVDPSKYSVSDSTSTTDDCTIEVSFTDIKDVATVDKDTDVIVLYDAEVTDDAVAGNPGNSNDARLEFSNDPYTADSMSNTPDDKVKVFQFKVLINKIDKDKNPVAGAEFELYRDDRADAADDPVWNKVGTYTKNADGTEFTFSGLKQGSYKLVESTVPDGYNKADDVEFELEAVYDTTSDDPAITSFVVKQDGNVVSEGASASFAISTDMGSATGSVVNTTGIKLPSTGEFGRAMIAYCTAGLLVMTVILCVLAGRMKDDKKED